MAKSCGAAFIDANVFVHSWTTDVVLSLANADDLPLDIK